MWALTSPGARGRKKLVLCLLHFPLFQLDHNFLQLSNNSQSVLLCLIGIKEFHYSCEKEVMWYLPLSFHLQFSGQQWRPLAKPSACVYPDSCLPPPGPERHTQHQISSRISCRTAVLSIPKSFTVVLNIGLYHNIREVFGT